MKRKSSYDGLQKDIRSMRLPTIEVWENKYPEKNYIVRLDTDEFTCICPKTGLPDFAALRIEYIPRRFCAELKSFKTYLVAYRNIGVFHEHAANRIIDDFVKASKPKWARISAEFNIRGGVRTTVEAERGKRPKE